MTDDLSINIEHSRTAPVEPDNTETQITTSRLSKEDQQKICDSIERHSGRFVRDKQGRFFIVYPDEDHTIENEYNQSLPNKVFSSDSYNEEFKNNMNMCMKGIEQQKVNKYPFSVILNPKTNVQLQTYKSGSYREGHEYKTIQPIYKHPSAFAVVDIVQDTFTGFKHICKSVMISRFRREEIEAMIQVPEYAPWLYGIRRDGEFVKMHMEYIVGKRADDVAKCLLQNNAWPFCLHLFSELIMAIQKMGLHRLSHGDIHVKNIIIETVNSGSSLRIRLIDYGDATKHQSASQYTVSGLMNDMKSIVSSIIAVFTGNEFDSYEDDPVQWIKKCKEEYPLLCATLQGALMAQNEKDISKLVSDLNLIIKDETYYEFSLRGLAKTLSVKHVPQLIPKLENTSISESEVIPIGNLSE